MDQRQGSVSISRDRSRSPQYLRGARQALHALVLAICCAMLLAASGGADDRPPGQVGPIRAAAKTPWGSYMLPAAPVIERVTVEPREPAAGQPVVVTARVSHQPFLEPAQVASVTLRATADGGATWQEHPMTPSAATDDFQANLGGWASGTEALLSVSAVSSLGSAAVQIAPAPAQWPPAPERLTVVMRDPDDLDLMVGDESDLLECRAGWDDEHLIVGMRAAGDFGAYVLSPVQTNFAMAAILNPDAAAGKGITDGKLLAYLPVPEGLPIPRFDLYDGEGFKPVPESGAEGGVDGEWLWMRCRREALGPNPSGRLLTFFVTGAISDMTDPDIIPKDAANYVMLYLGGQSVTVR